MRLRGCTALITGASQGIGEAIAICFAREGAQIAVLASKSKAKAQVVVDKIGVAGGIARPYVGNVADDAQMASVVAEVVADLGPIDVLVNSAGVFTPTPAGETSQSVYDHIMDTNLKGTWNPINQVVPAMKLRKSGKIINVASVAGVMGIGGYAVYCASKAGIVLLTRALACELAPFGINVNCIAPGNTATPMNEDIRTKPELKGFLDAMTARTPSGQTYSTAEDIAAVALFLASKEGRAMHGSCLLADEGLSAGI
jgi:NAD(P)-dependent dehydrogenase (short-subunit alcohol dehydrogenase family)